MEEIVTLFWKLGIAEFLEVRELLRRQELSDGVDEIFHNFDLELPISGHDLPLDRGWDCERMVVRAVAGKDRRNSTTMSGPTLVQGQLVPAIKSSQDSDYQNADHLEVEAVMGSALETMTRYQARLKRDLYRAIETLRKMQAERREVEGDTSLRSRQPRPRCRALHSKSANAICETKPTSRLLSAEEGSIRTEAQEILPGAADALPQGQECQENDTLPDHHLFHNLQLKL